MTIAVGDKIPDVEVRTLDENGAPQAVRTSEVLGSGKVVLFAVPGAYTPGCSKVHLPGFVQGAEELFGKGIDRVACIAVNDAWVMGAWGAEQGVGDSILMLADGNGDFAKAMGLEADLGGIGLGTRSKRYAAVIDNGTVTHLDVEDKPGVDVSSCTNVLTHL